MHGRDIWREDSQNRHATSRLRMYVIVKYFGVECICGDIFGLIFYLHRVVGNVLRESNVITGGADIKALTRVF